MADLFAKEVDFFSIGTNDLLQYSFAAARGSRCAEALIHPHSPVMLRLINSIARAGASEGIEVGICGMVAEDLTLLPVWVAMGINKLSVGSAKILHLKKALTELDISRGDVWLPRLLSCATHQEVSKILSDAFPKGVGI
jgi:phosphotransferase system enzyme I (PtsI)